MKIILICIIFLSQVVYAETTNERYAALIVDVTSGRVLYKYNAYQKLYPASLTKMMTVYVAFQKIKARKLSLNSKLTVSYKASQQARTRLGLRPGEKITLRDAIYATIILSANDAAVVIAEAIAGTESAFAYHMTQTARQLGMGDTQFKNASGLHNAQQYTTAMDMAKLGIALRRDFPQFYNFFSKKSFRYKGIIINGHNMVLKKYPWADGLKTGYTSASGFNLVTSAKRPEGKIIGVVLGGQTALERDTAMIRLLNDGFLRLSHHNKTSRSAYAGSLKSSRKINRPT